MTYILFLLCIPTSPAELKQYWDENGQEPVADEEDNKQQQQSESSPSAPSSSHGESKGKRKPPTDDQAQRTVRSKSSDVPEDTAGAGAGGGYGRGGDGGGGGLRADGEVECRDSNQENHANYNYCIDPHDCKFLEDGWTDNDPRSYSRYHRMYDEDPDEAEDDYRLQKCRRVMAARREGAVYLDRKALSELGSVKKL